jgi:hypothetical protein
MFAPAFSCAIRAERDRQIQGCCITAFTGHAGSERLFEDENWKGGNLPRNFPSNFSGG